MLSESRYGIFDRKGRQQDPVVPLCKTKQGNTLNSWGGGQNKEGRTDDHIKVEERQIFQQCKNKHGD